MAHRFTNLQNEFGKPVIAAGTKKPTSESDFIDLSWLDTTDEDGKKVVVDTTLEKVKSEIVEGVKTDVEKTINDKVSAAHSDLTSTIALVATDVQKEANKHTDEAIAAAKNELQTEIAKSSNAALSDLNEAKSELESKIKKVQEDATETSVAVLNELSPQIEENKKAIAEAKSTVYSTKAHIKDILERGFTFKHKSVTLNGPTYELGEGEEFIHALAQTDDGLTNFLPTIKYENGKTILRFFEDDEPSNIEITIILAVTLAVTKEGEESEEI